MSVLIKGMKMPENCIECMSSGLRTEIKCTEWTKISAGRRENERAWSCPLVDLGKHDRLIDADALIKFVEDRYEITWESDCYEGGIKDACSDIIEKIDTMPTVIEAEDGT